MEGIEEGKTCWKGKSSKPRNGRSRMLRKFSIRQKWKYEKITNGICIALNFEIVCSIDSEKCVAAPYLP